MHLTKTPAGNQARNPLMYGIDPWSVSIFDRPAGTLVLQAIRDIKLPRTADCTAAYVNCKSGSISYYKVEVPGDSPVVLADSATGVIQRAGRAYDAHVTSQTTPPSSAGCGADYHQNDVTNLDLKARDLTGLTFDQGTLPTCIEETGPIATLYMSASISSPLQGTATYSGRTKSGGLRFDLAELFMNTFQVFVDLSPATAIPEPTMGQQFWYSQDSGGSILRTSQQGELVAARVQLAFAAEAQQALGLTIAVEDDCAYTVDSRTNPSTTVFLQRVVLGSTPPVTIRAGGEKPVTIDGKTYRASNRAGSLVILK